MIAHSHEAIRPVTDADARDHARQAQLGLTRPMRARLESAFGSLRPGADAD
jgi:hypothetical protein